MEDEENADFSEMVKQNRENKQVKVERTRDGCKTRLHNIAATKIKTTMIGSLNAVEKKFGFLWGLDEDGNKITNELSDDQLYMKRLFDELRSEILDNGNNQIRNFGTEIEQYDIMWNRYHIDFLIKPEGPQGANNE